MALFGMFADKKREKPLILHIDDSHLVLMTAQAMLSGMGFDSVQSFSGEAGVKDAADKKPDLILVDAMMPAIDGYETVRRLRQQKETAATPIIMCTGDDSVKSIDQAMNAGANDYIVKPLKEDRLQAKIAALLKR